jgi:hypothetical protein
MTLALVSLRLDQEGSIRAELLHQGAALVTTTFTVSWVDSIATASPTPDIFQRFSDSAADVRRIVAAVLAFSAAAEVGPAPPRSGTSAPS